MAAVPTVGYAQLSRTWMHSFYKSIWSDFLKEPVDSMPFEDTMIHASLRELVLKGEWWRVYDFVEFVLTSPGMANRDSFRTNVEVILREEMAGFRVLAEQFVEITDETEVAVIEEALASTAGDRFSPARAHLATALGLLSDRTSPDYRNSIKESISSVEAITRILSGVPQAELGQALRILEGVSPVHGAFRRALLALYGYTSDANGIRHALSDEPNVDAADAKFMLVVCAAFVVLLVQKASTVAQS